MTIRRVGGVSGRQSRRIAFVSDAVYPFNKGGKERRFGRLRAGWRETGNHVRARHAQARHEAI